MLIPGLIAFFSWILVSFLVGIFYTTIYTSRLTKPGYTKVVNTIEEFIENGKGSVLSDEFEAVWLSYSP